LWARGNQTVGGVIPTRYACIEVEGCAESKPIGAVGRLDVMTPVGYKRYVAEGDVCMRGGEVY
jgi:hypothetical protein